MCRPVMWETGTRMSDFTTQDEGAPAPSGGGQAVTLEHVGKWTELIGLTIVNALLNLVTLTLYRFWARTKVRQKLWAGTMINGEPLEYTGTGWEVFKSFLIVVFCFILPVFLVLIGAQFVHIGAYLVAVIALYLIIYPTLGYVIFAARRYRMSRTTWRGVRFGMVGSGWSFGWAFFGWLLLTIITLGWYGPAMEMRMQRRLWNNTVMGDRQFKFGEGVKALAGPLYKSYALAWFGFIIGYAVIIAYIATQAEQLQYGASPTFVITLYAVIFGVFAVVSLFSIWYVAASFRRTAELLKLDGLSFKINANAGNVFWLYFGNILIIVFTLGLGLPFAQLRMFSYVFNNTTTEGVLDVDDIVQNPDRGPALGEGFADAFDLGTI